MSTASLMQRLVKFARLVVHFVSGLLILAIRFRHFTGSRRLAEIRRWSRKFLRLAGVRLEHTGKTPSTGLILMNHISWLDVIVLNALAPKRVIARIEFGRSEQAAGRYRRELASALHATISRQLCLESLHKEPGTLGGHRSGPR